MKKRSLTLLAIATGSALAASSASAAVLASFNFTDGPRDDANDATLLTGITAVGNITSTPTGSRQGEFAIANDGKIPTGVSGWDARSSVDSGNVTNTFFEFSVTVGIGYTLNLTSLTLDSSVETNLGNNTSWGFTISAGGVGQGNVSPVAATSTNNVATTTNGELTFASNAQTTNLGAGTYTIVIDPFAIGNTNGVASQRAGWIDNVVLNGNVSPIPEPSSTALLGLGGLGLILRRRR